MVEGQNIKRVPDLSALKIDINARPNLKRKRKTIIFTISGVLFFLIITALVLKNRKVTVEVAEARPANPGKGIVILNASGYVTPRRRATVAAKITGRIQEMFVEEGMQVEAGQIIARLDDSDARVRVRAARRNYEVAKASLAELEVNLENAKRDLERIKKLCSEGVTTQQNLDHAQTNVDALKARLALTREQMRYAKAELEVALQDLENCMVRAPFKGIIVSKDAQVGEMVSPVSAGGGFTRTGIATIVDMDSLEIEVDVNESYIARVNPEQKVLATLDAYPEWQIPGKVRTIIPSADRQKATVKVRIVFDALDPKILPDMGVKVSFLNDKETPSDSSIKALIPRKAIKRIGEKQVVFLLKKGRVSMQPVKLGEIRGSDMEVFEGVSPGDTLIINGPENLKNGQRVEVKK